MMQIAVLIQDRQDAELACAVLRERGHACERHGLREFSQASRLCALVLADVHHAQRVLPVLHESREQGLRLPLLLVAGRDEQEGIRNAIEHGADDYLLRPLRRNEVATRAEILLARFHPQPQQVEVYGAYAFDLAQRGLRLDGKTLVLTQKEFDLALLFFRHLGRPLSRAFLQEAIWPGQEDAGRSVDTHVSRVRSKLGLRPERGFRLAPVYSFGYRLEQIAF